MAQLPLISAIMLAGRTPVPDIIRTIECFNSQTYDNKELIIVNNAESQYKAAQLNITASDNIFVIDTPTQVHAGMARNYGIRAANGQILAQFDANYWHSPERLKTQIATMAENQSQVCMLASTLKYSFISGNTSINRNLKDVILATMVFVRPKDIDYPDIDKNEEFGILEKMIRNNYSPITIANPELCCKLFLCEKMVLKPTNYGLSKSQLSIIKQILKKYKK